MAAREGRGVAVDDGVNRIHVTRPIELTETTVFADELPAIVRTLCARPLRSWRFWHTRRGIIRANRATKAVLREQSGLIGEDPLYQDLRLRWVACETVRQWCERQGIKFKGSAGGIGIELLTVKFPPPFAALRGRLSEDTPIRPAIYGGRAQAFFTGRYGHPCCLVDRTGAYCAVMRDLPLPYPYDYAWGPNLRAPGITEATIEETAAFPVLPRGASSEFPQGRKRGIWTNAEITRALDHGARLIKVHAGLHFIALTRALGALGRFLAEERERVSLDTVLGGLLKRIPNALIGRFAAPPSVCVNRTPEGEKHWRANPKFLSAVPIGEGVISVELAAPRRPSWYAAAWSAAILAEQRLELHERIVSFTRAGYRVLSVDTDGLLLGLEGQPVPVFVGQGVGSYRVSWTADACVIRGPKTYTAETDVGLVGKRAGVPHTIADRLELIV